jgi:molybdopterin/thiamine biosynthesis adenylyltransferase
MMTFDYDEFVMRNLGFVSHEEQKSLRKARIFIPGVGGMGGTALECLVRTGLEHFIFSDPDVFEISNLNRQIFSNLDVIGQNKAQAAAARLKKINPFIEIEIVGADWVERLDEILPKVDLVINGCDDIRATLQLYRSAKKHQKTVIDAYASTLPNVYSVRASDPRPEEFLGFNVQAKLPSQLTDEETKACGYKETLHVLTHSSTAKHVVSAIAAEMVQGKRKRISLAPMVWGTGILMAYEALKVVLGRGTLSDYRGIFWNPWDLKIEKPLPSWIAFFKRQLVIWYLKKLNRTK